MKILYIITQGEWGGAQKYVFDLATDLAGEHNITIAVGELMDKGELQEKLRITNYVRPRLIPLGELRIVELKHLVRKISPWHDTLAVFELRNLYKKLNPDIVHLNSSKAGIIGSIAKLFHVPCSIKIIYTIHGWVFNEPLNFFKKNFYLWLEKLTARWKDKIIVLSDFDYQTGQKASIPSDKFVKIPLGINQSLFLEKQKARESLSKITNYELRITNFIVGTIANLYPTKGLDILVEAVKKIKNFIDIENIKFIIIGEGEERSKLQSLIDKYNLSNNIFLLGAMENAAEYLSTFDLFVLPSRKEGLPYTIMEAMTAGVPIITTNVGGIPSLINDTNGIMIDATDSKQLANSILWAIKNPDEMKKRAERAFEKIKDYPLEKMLIETKDLYASILK